MTVIADILISVVVLLVAVMNLINIKRISDLEKAVLELEEFIINIHGRRADK